MNKHLKRVICIVSILLIIGIGADATAAADGYDKTDFTKNNPKMIEHFQDMVRHMMEVDGIPGVSITLLDDKSILWAEGFGYTDRDGKTPVNPDTIFSLQSISKCITATAIMKAVKDGLLDLDKPITDYLPDFTVNSVFEEHPEKKMTLRLLLSHKAGFSHEAPVGNNLDSTITTFDEHIKSISTTWLRFPVGQDYAYSNLGIDLAGYILQKVSGKEFHAYVDEALSTPIGMTNSTFDMSRIKKTQNRAIGHDSVRWRVPLEIPMIPEGGYYSSAIEMAKFIQYHMNGNVSEEMYKIPSPMVGQTEGYALGVEKYYKHNTVFYNHGGGGFGFITSIVWYPGLKLGVVVLTNCADMPAGYISPYDLGQMILDAVITDSTTVFHSRMVELQKAAPVSSTVSYTDIENRRHSDIYTAVGAIKDKPLPDEKRWSGFIGQYTLMSDSVPFYNDLKVTEKNGNLFLNNEALTEVRPGFFLTYDGEALNLSGATKTLRNTPISKLDFGIEFYEVLLLVCAVIFLVTIILWSAKRKGQKDQVKTGLASFAKILQGANSVLGLLMIVIIAYVLSILSLATNSALNLQMYGSIRFIISTIRVLSPLILLLVPAMGVFTVFAWKYKYWSRFQRIWYSSATVAGIVFLLLMFRLNVVLI